MNRIKFHISGWFERIDFGAEGGRVILELAFTFVTAKGDFSTFKNRSFILLDWLIGNRAFIVYGIFILGYGTHFIQFFFDTRDYLGVMVCNLADTLRELLLVGLKVIVALCVNKAFPQVGSSIFGKVCFPKKYLF